MNEETYAERIHRKLTASFAPTLLEIKDVSTSHAGHAGHDSRGESHFTVKIVSASFTGMNPVARHRAIYAVLAEELQTRLHALSLKIMTPEEHTNK